MSAPHADMATAELVALRSRLARDLLDNPHGDAVARRAAGVDVVLTAREARDALAYAQHAARWAEVLAEHDPGRAAVYASEAERATERAHAYAISLHSRAAASADAPHVAPEGGRLR